MNTEPKSKNDPYKDPVCNMEVAGDSKYQYRHAGKQYYFCCDPCLNKFKEQPMAGQLFIPAPCILKFNSRDLAPAPSAAWHWSLWGYRWP
jgi:YHS domain-containing protein